MPVQKMRENLGTTLVFPGLLAALCGSWWRTPECVEGLPERLGSAALLTTGPNVGLKPVSALGEVTVWIDTTSLTSVTEHNRWPTSGWIPGRHFSTEGCEVLLCPLTSTDEKDWWWFSSLLVQWTLALCRALRGFTTSLKSVHIVLCVLFFLHWQKV